jgi:hypothetical protein
LHQLLALTFPELAVLVKDISLGWVLELLHRYPTAALLASASGDDLACIPYLPHGPITALLEAARSSVGSLAGATAEELVRDQLRQLRDANARIVSSITCAGRSVVARSACRRRATANRADGLLCAAQPWLPASGSACLSALPWPSALL